MEEFDTQYIYIRFYIYSFQKQQSKARTMASESNVINTTFSAKW